MLLTAKHGHAFVHGQKDLVACSNTGFVLANYAVAIYDSFDSCREEGKAVPRHSLFCCCCSHFTPGISSQRWTQLLHNRA